ncbi:MAG: MATE family efflux transporter [Firmicutes bacterium]|nr:MATE family efflux transporter [Bacillota bacterium]
MNIIRRLFSTNYMVKEHMRKGDIPPSKEAYKNSLRIAIPAVIEMVSIALMDMIDTVMVGRVGPQAMTAVGITGQPRMLILSIFFALNIALTAIIARKKGAGEMHAARSCLRHGLLINIILGLKLTLLAFIFAQPLMALAGAQPDTIYEATSYFRITNLVLVFQIMTMTICVAQRAIGNTKVALKVNATAKVVSVILNFLLIEGRFGFPRLEVDGVAYARSIAAVVAFSLALASILHKDSPLRIRLKDYWGFEKVMLKSVGKLTANGMLEQVSLRFGFFAYARVIANLGTEAFAAHIIAMQLMVLSFTFADGIGAATTSLVGQNLGKERPDLSSMYGKIGMRLAIICATMLSTLCILFRFQFAALFTTDPDIVLTAGGLIFILAGILPLQTSQLVMGGSLRGAGDTRYVALTMLITVGVMRPLLGFLMVVPLGWGLTGAWIAMVFDQATRLIMLFTRFARGKWMTAKV